MGDKKDSQMPGIGTTRDDVYLEKNRISGIELADEKDERIEKTKKFDKKPIIILSSIAAALLIGILVVTQFVFKKPAVYAPSSANQNAPFDGIRREENLASANEHINRGKESYSRGYHSDAIAEFNEAVDYDAPDQDKAIALTYLGMISDDKGEYDKAVDFLTRAQTYDRNNPDIYKNLSLAYRHKKDFDKALERAEKSASLREDDTDAKILMGNIYFETGKYDEAGADSRGVLDKTPDNPRVLYNMGSALMQTGDEFAAVEYFKKAGAADRIGEGAHKAYSRLGVIYIERKAF